MRQSLLLLLLTLVLGCTSSSANKMQTPTVLEIENGFEGMELIVEVAGEVVYQDKLTGAFPLQGVLRSVSIDIPKGNHEMQVNWRKVNSTEEMKTHRHELKIDDADSRVVSIRRTGRKVQVTTKETTTEHF